MAKNAGGEFTGFDGGNLAVGGGVEIASILRASSSVDLASIAATTTGAGTVTVTGARVGDAVIVNPRADFNDDLVMKEAYVSANNTVTIKVYNPSAGAIDASAVTVDVIVLHLAS